MTQGSVLGPLLLPPHINDLPSNLELACCIFAHDVKAAAENDPRACQKILNHLTAAVVVFVIK